MSRKRDALKRSQCCAYDRPRTQAPPPGPPGRRLSAAEVEAVAASLGLGVSENRFAKESDRSRAQRALAYDQGRKLREKLKHDGVPKGYWLKGSGPSRRRVP
jgi:hypothetical protein